MSTVKKEYYPSYTYEDYAIWKGDWELIDGIPYALSPSATIQHQRVVGNIATYLHKLLDECKMCQSFLPIDWKINTFTVVRPDTMVICHTPWKEEYILKAPKIIFEVLSKSTATKDLNLKYDLYEQEGVNYYIIVDPKDSIAKVYKLHEGRYIKMCDAYEDIVTFTLDECGSFEFDFAKIW